MAIHLKTHVLMFVMLQKLWNKLPKGYFILLILFDPGILIYKILFRRSCLSAVVVTVASGGFKKGWFAVLHIYFSATLIKAILIIKSSHGLIFPPLMEVKLNAYFEWVGNQVCQMPLRLIQDFHQIESSYRNI